jgi:hypothetical protein
MVNQVSLKLKNGVSMMKHFIKIVSCLTITLFSLQTYADNRISIQVKTSEKTAAGIGYSVGGKELGGSGKSYSGKGPINQRYLFGYRKNSANGPNIQCGSLILTKNSSVTLVTKGNKCQSVLNR